MSQPLANSYVITNTADPNTTIVEVLDISQSAANGTRFQTSYSGLKLVRRGARPYADIVSEDMIHMLENFSNSAPPPSPMFGQLWYDSGTQTMKVFQSNSQWKSLAATSDIVIGLPTNASINITQEGNHGVVGSGTFSGGVATIQTRLSTTAVLPGNYNFASITVDAYGRITGASSGTVPNPDLSTRVAKTGDTMTGTLNITGANQNLNVQSGKVMEGGYALLPAGAIIMWSGSTAPSGWALCNGGNGTPDLRDRFIVAAGSTMPLNSAGGSNTLSLSTSPAGFTNITVSIQNSGSHSHGGAAAPTTLTIDQIPSHKHISPFNESTSGGAWGNDGTTNNFGSRGGKTDGIDYDNIRDYTSPVGGSQSHNHGISADGDHGHGATASSVPDHTHSIPSVDKRPSYYALAFIMKL